MEKPIEEYLSELPDGYRELALENRKNEPRDYKFASSIPEAIHYGFFWRQTPQGHGFWSAVCEHFVQYPLPPLPE